MRRTITSTLLALGCMAAFAAGLAISFRAGCAGDTKGGTVGNVHIALELEGVAFGFNLLLLVLIAAFLSYTMKMRWAFRAPVMAVAIVATCVCTPLLGIEAEFAGVRNCF